MTDPTSIPSEPARDEPTVSTPRPDLPDPVDALPRRVEMPAGSHDKLRTWGLLVVVVGMCLAPLLIELGAADTTYTMEKIALLSSQETWMRTTGHWHELYGWTGPSPAADEHGRTSPDRRAWLIPTWNGRPRINKPPMFVWLNLLAWSGLDPADTPPQALVLRARLLGVLLVALALAATFWAGYSIGQLRTAALAVLITGSSYLLIKQGRRATYDTHLLCWVTLSVAGGLWAMRPLKPVNWISRRVGGWVICGLALAAAILTKGPVASVFVIWPLLASIALMPRRRLGNITGLLFAVMLGVLAAAPWYLQIIRQMPDAWRVMLREYQAQRQQPTQLWYYLMIFYLLAPWTVWLIAALCQPWIRARGEFRRQLLIAWVWLVGLLVILSCKGAKNERYLIPLLPAAGLLIAQLWAWHGTLADQRQKDPGVNLLRLPHWIGMAFASLVAVPLWAWGNPLTAWINQRFGLHLDMPNLGSLGWWILAPWGAALVIVCLIGIRWHWRWKPVHAAVATAVWSLIFMTVVYAAYAHSPHSVNPARADARLVHQLIGHAEFRFLYNPTLDPKQRKGPGNFEPNEEFLFYVRRVVEPLRPEHLDEYARRPAFLMVRYDRQGINLKRMKQLHYRHVIDFDDGIDLAGFLPGRAGLFRTPAPAVRPSTTPTPTAQLPS